MWILFQIATSIEDDLFRKTHLRSKVCKSIKTLFRIATEREYFFIEFIAHIILSLHSEICGKMREHFDIIRVFYSDIFEYEFCFCKSMISLIQACHQEIQFTISLLYRKPTYYERPCIIDLPTSYEGFYIIDYFDKFFPLFGFYMGFPLSF